MSQTTKVERVAIVGCGEIAEFHLPAIRAALPDARILFCDLDRARAEKLAKRDGRGEKGFSDFDDLLRSEKPQSAHILTSAQTHFRLSKLALTNGCHVLVEKPASDTEAEIKELYGIADQRGLRFSADHTLLGMPIVREAFEVMKSGELGRLIAAHCDFGAARGPRLPYDAGHWAYAMRGGVVANNASHPASLLLEIMDPMKSFNVQAVTRNVLPNKWPDVIHVSLQSDSQVGSFTLSQGHGNGDRRAHLQFERGYIYLDFASQLSFYSRGTWPHGFVKKATSGVFAGMRSMTGTVSNILGVLTGRLPKNPGLYNIVGNFYGTGVGEDRPMVSRDNVMAVTRLMEGVWNRIESDFLPMAEKGDGRR